MSTFGAFAAAVAGPLAKKVLTSLGIGVVTFVGLDLATAELLSQAQSAWAGAGPKVAAVMAMAGFNSALALLAGAMTTRVAMASLKKMDLL